MVKRKVEIDGVDSLKTVLREYNALHVQLRDTAKKAKPVNRRFGEIKKALLSHMIGDNLKKIQLPNKDLLVVVETAKKPSMSEKYLKGRLDAYFEGNPGQAGDLLAFIQAVPEEELGVKSSLKHYEADSYIEQEDGEESG